MTATHEAIVASRFDALHERFKASLAADDPRLLAILGELGPLEGMRMLDLGCGKGRFARALVTHGAEVLGLDASRAMLAAANSVDRVQASVRRLPFASLTFDAVLAVEVLEHLERRALDGVLAEVRRVLRPGGRFLIIDKNVFSWNAHRRWLPSVVLEMDRRASRLMDVFTARSGARAPVSTGRLEAAAPQHLLRRASCSSFVAGGGGAISFRVPAGHPAFCPLDGPSSLGGRMTELYSSFRAWYPLLLWKTPPGLELILAQEGVAFETIEEPRPFSFRTGRFVLFDSRAVAKSELSRLLTPQHVAIDIDALRDREPVDPFVALVDQHAARATWALESGTVSERVGRFPKAWIRRRLVDKLRRAIQRAGAVWIRLAPFPYPYRSAFGLRVDLDEPAPGDYHRYARALGSLAECCTHFVSTHAYGHSASVLSDLRRYDTQSHGHYHHVYRDPEANRNNVERADRILRGCGFQPHGFAAPHGRWRPSLDDALEDLGYSYSSDFQLGYDDLPFYPWKADRFSRILQIPVHPVCEGLFLEAGVEDPEVIGNYMRRLIASKLAAGELAIVYGHPERRLGAMPQILKAIASAVEHEPLVWRTTFTELSRFWRWRGERRWLVIPRDRDRLEIQFDEWDRKYPLALEIQRGRFRSLLPLAGPRTTLPLDDLAYERIDDLEAESGTAPNRSQAAGAQAGGASGARLGDRDPAGCHSSLVNSQSRQARLEVVERKESGDLVMPSCA